MFEAYTRIALAVNACKDGVRGRKKLQKMIYIAQALGYPFREDFTLYWYGPYSHELASELRRMEELSILNERQPPPYIIELTETGKSFLEYFKNNIIKEMGTEQFPKMIDLFRYLSHYRPWQLEILATLFYFHRVENRGPDLLKDVVGKIKPKFSSQEIDVMAKKMTLCIRKFSADQ